MILSDGGAEEAFPIFFGPSPRGAQAKERRKERRGDSMSELPLFISAAKSEAA